jgi:putative endonuclease
VEQSSNYYVYILESLKTGSYYIGQTRDISKRLVMHNCGRGTSSRRDCPWRLIYAEGYTTRGEAMKRESQIKGVKKRSYIQKLLAKHAGA